MTEGTPYPPQQPGQPAQPPGGYPPPQTPPAQTPPAQTPPVQTPPPAGGYPPPQAPSPQPPATGYPQQGYQQPGQAQQYPQQNYPQQQYPQQGQSVQPPKKSNVKKILLILGLVIGLPLIGIGACTFFFVGLVKGPINESNAMLALLDEGKYQEAYDSFDPTCTDDFGVEDLRGIWDGVEIDGYDLKSVNVVNSNADVSGTVSVNGGLPNPISFELNKRDGDWKVCGFTVE